MGLFGPIVAQNSKVLGTIRGHDGCNFVIGAVRL